MTYFIIWVEKLRRTKTSVFARRVAESFGSYEAWEQDYKATGAMRGIGWVVLYQDWTGHF